MMIKKTIILAALMIGMPAIATSTANASPEAAPIVVASAERLAEKDGNTQIQKKSDSKHKHLMSDEKRAEWENLSPEERDAKKTEMRQRHEEKWQKRLEEATPEQREEMIKKRAEWKQKREAVRAELESLPPEERKARMEELRQEFKEKHQARMEERREKFGERWEQADPEDKEKFCDRARERCEASEGEAKACNILAEKCSDL